MNDTFKAGFEVARLLGNPEFRAVIRRIDENDCIVIGACKTTPIGEVVNLVFKNQVQGKTTILAVIDEELPAGVELLAIDEIATF